MDIVGQGLAGTLLGWACAEVGVDFRVWDPGAGDAASLVGAGLITPVTGQRFVPTEGINELWPFARAVYQRIATELGVPLWREVRVQRLVRTAREREALAHRLASGTAATWIERVVPAADEAHRAAAAGGSRGPAASPSDAATATPVEVWLAPAAQVDLAALLSGSRARWQAEGRLVPRRWSFAQRTGAAGWATVLCAGAGVLALAPDARWLPARGETLDVRCPELRAPAPNTTRTAAGEATDSASNDLAPALDASCRGRGAVPLAPDVVRNDGHWAVALPASPIGAGPAGVVRVGATYAPGETNAEPTPAARAMLLAAAHRLLGGDAEGLSVVAQRAGIRVTTPDRRPVAAWCDAGARLGVFGGLGSKGVLTAPALARAWVARLREVA